MQQDLVQDAAEHITVAFGGGGDFHCLGDRATEGTGGAGMLREDLAADCCFHGRRRRDGCAVGAHDFTAERLLLIGDLDHVDLAVQAQVRACHGKCGAPLAGAGLGGDAFEALLLCVVCLRDRRIQLVGSAGVVSLELVVDLCRGVELFLKAVRADQRRRTVHLVEIQDIVRDRDVGRVVVQFLLDQLIAENACQFLCLHGFVGARVEKGRRLVLHVGTDIVPCFRHLGFFKVDFIWDLIDIFAHDVFLSVYGCLPGQSA